MTLGKSPLPRCMKMKRIGGVPAGVAAERQGPTPGSESPPMARKAFLRKSRLVFILRNVVGGRLGLLAISKGIGGEQGNNDGLEAAAALHIGSVRLKDANPASHPLIDPNYWADPYDREMSLRGLKLARDILRQPALKDYILAERVPGPDVATDDALFGYACGMAKTQHHPAGTCAMGLGDNAVVGLDLKVHGLQGLRVVDASIMPNLVSSNTNATTIMIAEKAADLILAT